MNAPVQRYRRLNSLLKIHPGGENDHSDKARHLYSTRYGMTKVMP
jgi:hypothetical protein